MLTIDKGLIKHRAEFLRALDNNQFEMTENGILFTKQHAIAHGVYTHDVNGQDERSDKNLLTTEGMTHMLNTEFHGGTPVGTWYFRLFSANVTPLATWTGANFTANATEIVSTSEGWAGSVGFQFDEAAPSAANVNNTASKAAFTIVTASSLNIWGAGLDSVATRGDTTGVLMSASKFAAARVLYNTDVFNLGYSLSLTSS